MSNDTNPATPVAIIGLGCFFPRATGTAAYWHLLYHGKDAITDVPASHWSPNDYFDEDPSRKDHVYCHRGGFLSPIQFDPTEFGIPPSNLESTDTSQLIGLMAAKMALETAGYGSETEFDRDRTSVILGVTGTQELVIPLSSRLSWPKWKRALENARVDPEKARQVMTSLEDEYVEWQENSFPGLLGNVVAGRICNRLDLNGTNCVVDAACASSMSAINLALLELYTDRSRMVVTGGVDTLNDIFMHMCFARTQILSPSGDARPFSQNADGTVLGEGVGILILKRLEDAVQDGDHILSIIKGIGSSSDGKSQSIYAPRAEGQLKALREAYEAAAVSPRSVDLIEAHGTGTRVGDKIEVQALKMLFAEDDKKEHCALGSVKSMIGHTKAAAGSAGIIKAVLALHHKILPPTLKADRPDPEMGLEDSPFYLNNASRPWFRKDEQPRRAGVSAFGFGGSNFHVVLEEYQAEKTGAAWDGSIEIIALSAASYDDLVRSFEKVSPSLLEEKTSDTLPFRAAELRRTFDAQQPFRLLMILQREEGDQGPAWNCDTVLEEARKGLDQNPDQAFWFGRASFFGQGPAPGPVAFLFPGQGSQYLQMGRDWVAWFPEALATLEMANRHYRDSSALTDHIYPRVSDEQRETLETALRNTAVAQPAIGAVSIAMDKVLRRFGVVPEFTCGHSYGELTAFASAGWIDEKTLFDLSVLRGKLMAASDGPEDTSRGTMTAVKAPLDKLEKLLADKNLDVVLANRNSPNQGVLSGAVANVEKAEAVCKAHKFRTIRLPVSAAFHSSLMEEAQAPFAAALQEVDFQPGNVRVYANTTGQPYPDDPGTIKSILGDHLLNPVNFVTEINNLYEAGVRVFIEVGPKTVLTGLVRQILKGHSIHALATDAGSGRQFGIADLAVTLSKLAALGLPVKLTQWEGRNGNPRRPKMKIPISGANAQRTKTRKAAKAAAADKPLAASAPANRPSAAISAINTADGPPPPRPVAVPAGKPFPDQAETNPSTPAASSPVPDVPLPRDPQIQEAFNLVQQGLMSLQSLQEQTTAAHHKFLETQQQASRALQEMMASTRQFAETALGSGMAPKPNPTRNGAVFPAAAQPEIPRSSPLTEEQTAVPPRTPLPEITPPAAAADKAVTESAVDTPRPDTGEPPSVHNAGQILRQVISELTGYPDEMLGMAMDLETDLGIDSIKRVEILATLEERMPALPGVTPEAMAALRTLGEVAEFLEGASNSAPKATASPEAAIPPTAGTPDDGTQKTLLTVVSELTGYPTDMLALEMDLESDLGIDSIKRVEILAALEERLADLPAVPPDEMAELKTLGEIAAKLAASASLSPASSPSTPKPSTSRAPADGIETVVMAVVSELTGYPVEMLAADMDIESDL
ncbi:MAG: beta-ketoacyl synthase N-terminal-like domain-containing protein, partial [Desulfobacterales bacterium]